MAIDAVGGDGMGRRELDVRVVGHRPLAGLVGPAGGPGVGVPGYLLLAVGRHHEVVLPGLVAWELRGPVAAVAGRAALRAVAARRIHAAGQGLVVPPDRLERPARLLLGHDVHGDQGQRIPGREGAAVVPERRGVEQRAVAGVHRREIRRREGQVVEPLQRHHRGVRVGDRPELPLPARVEDAVEVRHRRRSAGGAGGDRDRPLPDGLGLEARVARALEAVAAAAVRRRRRGIPDRKRRGARALDRPPHGLQHDGLVRNSGMTAGGACRFGGSCEVPLSYLGGLWARSLTAHMESSSSNPLKTGWVRVNVSWVSGALAPPAR